MKRYKKIGAIILICAFLSVNLSSCFDDREMNELAYVIALGIDVSGDGEYNYTFQISNPIASGGGGEEKPSKEMSTEEGSKENSEESEKWDKSKIKENKNTGVMEVVVKAKDYAEAVELVNNIISKRINLAHLKVIAFSDEAAREGIDKHTSFLMSEREIRPGTNVLVAENSAEYFLKNVNPKLDMSTAKYYELLINNENMNYSQAVELRELYDKGFGEHRVDGILPLGSVSEKEKSVDFSADNKWVENDNSSMMSGNVNRLSSEKTELFGAAVLNDMKMVGAIDGEMVKYYKLIMGEIKDGTVFSDNESHVVIKNCKKSCFFVDTSEDSPKITIDIYAEAENADNIEELKQKMEDNIYILLIRTAREYEADVFGISEYARKKFMTWQEFENYDWSEKYKNSVFSVNVKLKNSEFSSARFVTE